MTDGPGKNGFTVIELMVTLAKPNVIGIVVRVVQCGADGANEVRFGVGRSKPIELAQRASAWQEWRRCIVFVDLSDSFNQFGIREAAYCVELLFRNKLI